MAPLPHRPRTTPRVPGTLRRVIASALTLAALVVTSCGSPEGLVELNWHFVDASASDTITPTCHVDARDAIGSRDMALRVRLTVSRADDECNDPALAEECIVAQEVFACDRERGTLDNVPASDEPYMMTVDVLAYPDRDDAVFEPPTTCVTTPGPRTRSVEAGRIADLGVYEIVVHTVDLSAGYKGRYNLESCGADD